MTNCRAVIWTASLAAALAAALLMAGCSAPSSTTQAAEATAQAFRAAVAEGDSETACELLTGATAEQLGRDGTPCAAAIGELGLADPGPLEGVDVWGRSALARFAGEDVDLFLTRVNGVWRVNAAGCSLRDDRPAECEVGG